MTEVEMKWPVMPIFFAAFSNSNNLLDSVVVVVHFWDVEETLGTFKWIISSWALIEEKSMKGKNDTERKSDDKKGKTKKWKKKKEKIRKERKDKEMKEKQGKERFGKEEAGDWNKGRNILGI